MSYKFRNNLINTNKEFGLVFNKLLDTSRYHKESIIALFVMLIISYLSTYLLLVPINDNAKYTKELYFNIDDQIALIDKFGLITYTKVDIKRQLFGFETKLVVEENNTRRRDRLWI